MLALLSGKIDKYKYLTDEDPHSVKQLKNKQKQLKIKE